MKIEAPDLARKALLQLVLVEDVEHVRTTTPVTSRPERRKPAPIRRQVGH